MKNNKGYMLVEIILASVIAFGIAYFILDMTIKLKNKNDDLLVETQVMTDKTIINNKLMKYIKEDDFDFDCDNINVDTDNKIIRYKSDIVDKVSDYAVLDDLYCNVDKENKEISVVVYLSVPQMPDKDYNVEINYKFLPNPIYTVTYDYNYNLFASNGGNWTGSDGNAITYSYNPDSNLLTMNGTWVNDGVSSQGSYFDFQTYKGTDYAVNNKFKLNLEYVSGSYETDTNFDVLMTPHGFDNSSVATIFPKVNEGNFSNIFTLTEDMTSSDGLVLRAHQQTDTTSTTTIDNYQVKVFLSRIEEVLQEYKTNYVFPSVEPTLADYKFVGWYTERDGGTKINDTDEMTNMGNMTLYAHWELLPAPVPDEPQVIPKDKKYTVNHYIHNLGEDKYTLKYTNTYYDVADATVSFNNLKRTISGYTYTKGFVNRGGVTMPDTSYAVTSTTVLANGSRVINLYYRRNYLRIQYHVNGGKMASSHGANYSVNSSTSLVNRKTSSGNFTDTLSRGVYGSKVGDTNSSTYVVGTDGLHDLNNANAINLTRSGYTVKSGQEWNTKANGKGTTYNQKTSTYKAKDMAEAAGCDLTAHDCVITLYAKWVKSSESTCNWHLAYYNCCQQWNADGSCKSWTGYMSASGGKPAGEYCLEKWQC